MTFALSTIEVKGTGNGTGDSGRVCAFASTAASEKIKARRPKPSQTRSGFIKRKRNRESLVSANPLSTGATHKRGPPLQKRQSRPWGFFLLCDSLRESGRLPLRTGSRRLKTVAHKQPHPSFSSRAGRRQSHLPTSPHQSLRSQSTPSGSNVR